MEEESARRRSPEICPICQQKAEKTCSGCSSIFYCSSEHQKAHWSSHKGSCRPYIIKRNERYGRYVVAARDLAQGTIVMTEGPLVVGPKRATFPLCLGCHKRVDCSYHCSKCTFPLCNEKCENAPAHAEWECPIFQKGHPIGAKIVEPNTMHPAYEAVTPLRCLLMRERDPTRWTRLNSMEHHNEVRRTTAPNIWNRNEVNTVKLLREWYGLKETFDPDTIHRCIGFVDVNGFEIKSRSIEVCGLYPEASLMCHDCTPNTHHATTVGPSFQMIVRTSVPIRKGEIISTSYVDSLKGTFERRQFLKETKYFDCLCKRCQDPTEFGTFLSAVKCGQCPSGYLLPTNPTQKQEEWACGDCPNSTKFDKISRTLNKLRKEVETAESCEVGSRISKLERVLRKYSGKVVHPNHYYLLSIMMGLIKLYLDDMVEVDVEQSGVVEYMDAMIRKRELCLQMLNVLDMVEQGLMRQRGVVLYHLFTVEFPILQIQYRRGEAKREVFLRKCEEMIASLNTTKEILALDRLIVDHPTLSLKVDKAIDSLYEEKSRVEEGQKLQLL